MPVIAARTRARPPAAAVATGVRFGGFGGQGIALMGVLTGRAAVIHDGRQAVMTQSYGPEARGGASSADVIISSERVDYPLVTRPDVLVVLFQEAYRKFAPGLKPTGRLLIDGQLVTPEPGLAVPWGIPATRIAEELGARICANIVMLGFFAAVSGLVSRRALEETIRTTMKPKIVDLNLRALGRGFDHAAVAAAART